RNLLYFLTGSLGGSGFNPAGTQGYWVGSAADVAAGRWQDFTTQGYKYRDQHLNEWAAFTQDDWKITKTLTLNLGLRYEYYGIPYLKGGFTSAPIGLGDGLFGVGRASGDLFSNWLFPGNIYLTGYGGAAAGLTSPSQALRCVSGVQQSPLLPVS